MLARRAATALAGAALALGAAAPGIALAEGVEGANVNVDVNVKCRIGGEKQDCPFSKKRERQIEQTGEQVISDRVAAGDGPVYKAVYSMVEPLVDYWVGYATALGYSIAYAYIPG